MSTTIDQRVVEMRFDNKNFEANVQTSMSTLEKLKQRLNLTGATKGLDNLGSAAKKVNLGNLGSAADTVGLKFNAMYSMADQALRNITSRVQHTAENLVKSFTIDPVKTGLQEYETQINAVQTILANTQHNGTTLDEVNSALDTLNTYADKTIYNFTEMTRNIGTFTAAGVDLQTSVESIQGIANLAAVSGSTSQQASTAMYQLSQALAAGKVSLMDWNSVVNAGMGGKVFQDALLRTSELLKTGGKEAVKTYGSFRESLTKGEWLTTEVLTETLKQLSGAYSEADLIAQGFTKEQAKEISELAETATNAATKVKTFTQLMDTLKEATQSGWTQTWEILVGDFEEAKKLWTGVSDTLGEIIGKSADRRNKMLSGAMDSGWDKMIGKIEEAGIEAGTFEEKLKSVLKGKGHDVDKIIEKYGSLEEAFQSGKISTGVLKEAIEGLSKSMVDLSKVDTGLKMGDTGEDVKKVQEALKNLGYNFDKFGIDGIIGNETTTAIKAFQELKGLEVTGIVDEKTLEALKEASSSSSKLKGNIDELVSGVDKLGGRQLLIESFANIWKGLMSIIKPIKSAFSNIFPPMTSEQLYKLIEGFHSLTEKFILNHDQAKKLRKTFKGVFAIIDIMATVVGGGLKFALEAVSGILAGFNMDILDLTAAIGDAIWRFRNWVKSSFDFKKAFEAIAPIIKAVANFIKEFAIAVWEMPNVQAAIDKVVETFKGFYESIKKFLSGGFEGSSEDIINGLINGLKSGASVVWGAIVELATGIIAHFCEILGIQSPSTVMEEKGENIGEGLLNGLKAIAGKVWEFVKTIGTTIADIFGKIDWRAIFAAGMGIAMLMTVKKMVDVLDNISSPLGGIGDVLDSFANVSNNFAKKIKAQALKHIAEAIAILVGSLIALSYVVKNDWKSVGLSVVFIGLLAGVLTGLMFAMNKLNETSVKFEKGKGFNVEGLKSGLISIGIAIALLAVSVKLIGSMSIPQAIQGFVGLVALVGVIAGVFFAFGKLVTENVAANIDKVGGMLIKMSIAMGLLVGVCKLAGSLSLEDAGKGAGFAVAFILFITFLGEITENLNENIDKLGGMLIKMAIAMALLVGVCKLAGTLNERDAQNGLLFGVSFLAFIYVLVQITKVDKGQEFAKLGGTLMSISLAMILMVGLCKLIGLLKPEEIAGAIGFVAVYLVFVKVLVSILKTGSEEQLMKVGLTLLAMSFAIAILAGVAIMLGLISLPDLAKGVAAVTILGLVMKGMIAATKGAKKVKGSVIAMAAAIAVMAIAVAALSVIEVGKLAKSVAALSVVMLVFGKMAKSAGTMGKVMGPLIVLSAAIVILAYVLKMVAELPVDKALGSAVSLSILLLTMSKAMQIMSSAKTIGADALIAMGAMAAIVAVLGIVLGVLGKFDCTVSLETAVALSAIILALSGACVILSNMKTLGAGAVTGAASMMLTIVGAMAIISAVAGLIALIPRAEEFINNGIPILEGIAKGIGKFISGFIGGIGEGLSSSFKQMMKDFSDGISYLGNIPSTAIQGALNLVAIMGAMTGVNIADAISTFLTGDTPMETFKTNVLVFADAMIALSDKIGGTTIDSAAIESLAASGTAFATLNQSLPRQGGWIQDIVGEQDLSTFGAQVAAFAGAMLAINIAVSAEGFSFNEAAFTAMTTAGTKFVELNNALPTTGGWVQDIVGEQDLTAFGASCKAFADAMIEINTAVSGEGFSFNETAITAMTTAGTKFTELNAALPKTGGWAQDILGEQSLTDFGASVAAFAGAMLAINNAVSAEGFSFNETAFTAMVSAGTKFTELNSALPKTGGWAQDIVGEQSLTDFGASVAAFAAALITVNAAVSINGFTFNETAFTAMTTAGTKFTELNKALPKTGGWSQDILGEQSLTDFGASVAAFAGAMITINDAVSADGFTFNETAITAMVNAGTKLAELETTIPQTGGWWAKIAGKDDLVSFGEKIAAFGEAIGGFGTSVAGINSEAIGTAINTANSIKFLISSIADLDMSGVAAFTGIGTGGVGADGAISDIGEAMAGFSIAVAGIDTTAVSVSVSCATRLKDFINSLVDLDNSGISKFSLLEIGNTMKNYINYVKDMDPSVVSSSISAANRLKTFINSLADLDSSGISNFKVGTIGSTLKTYASNVSGIDAGAVSTSISAATKIKNFIASLASLDTSGVSSFKSAISSLGETNISGLTKTFNSASSSLATTGSNLVSSLNSGLKSKSSSLNSTASSMVSSMSKAISSGGNSFSSAGTALITNLVKGFSSKSSLLRSTASSTASNAASGIVSQYSKFYANGRYLGEGLVSGINSKKTSVWLAGYNLGKAAVEGEKAGQKSNSPSKLTIQAGKWFGEGLVIGIDAMGTKVYKAGHAIGDTAVKSLSTAMARASEAVDSGMFDNQPTIRPVLDLSDVKAGAGNISNLLGMGRTIGVSANVGAVSASMNSRIQNGGNGDVVSAINKLSKQLSNVGGSTYNVNGVTYDDGTNVSNAVQSLIRAAKIEGRA